MVRKLMVSPHARITLYSRTGPAMGTLTWIVASTAGISLLALIGLVGVFLEDRLLRRLLLPLVAFSAGSMMGAAYLHLLPEAVAAAESGLTMYLWLLGGYALFLSTEQFIHWHRGHVCDGHPHPGMKRPVTYLLLGADALHNFVDGLAIGTSFLISVEAGVITSIAAACHEIPQELGDFGILVYGGWDRGAAVLVNFGAALTVIAGGLLAFFAARRMDTVFLLPFAAGNFTYIAASDLIPEIKHAGSLAANLLHGAAFVFGVLALLSIRLWLE